MKIFLHVLKRLLNEKYPNINFEFYISCRSKYVYMEMSCSILTLREHDQIICDIEEVWLLKRQDKFVIPQLIHTTKWKFDYFTFRKILIFFKNVYRMQNIF